ncbi:MAG TPA: hypothetical protein PLW86_06670 [Rhodocyclaceae bacterium]|nr:hypothetical protein [Rhodocyclaceae bacterium]
MNSPDMLQIEIASRRTAGMAALRKIRRIVDAEIAHEQIKATWAKRFTAGFGILLIVAITWSAYHALLR